jgi:hypothetical protein
MELEGAVACFGDVEFASVVMVQLKKVLSGVYIYRL